MNVFVYEFISSGAMNPTDIEPSLIREGRAMLRALIEDLLTCSNIETVQTIWNSQFGRFSDSIPDQLIVKSPKDNISEIELFHQNCRACDATMIVAPEFDSILHDRSQIAFQHSRCVINCDLEAIKLCSDKLILQKHLEEHNIRSVPTHSTTDPLPPSASIVVKPRFGAGSVGIRTVNCSEFTATENAAELQVVQPLIRGRSLSVGLLFSTSGRFLGRLPVAEQHLSTDGQFKFLGGTIPAKDVNDEDIDVMVLKIVESMNGLRGYVGVDFIIPDGDAPPIVVEINPRVCTSYVGYRMILKRNLVDCVLCDKSVPLTAGVSFQFNPEGATETGVVQ